MKRIGSYMFLLCITILISCNSSQEASEVSSMNATSNNTAALLLNQEISQINAAYNNGGQYEVTKEELDQLLSDGDISQEQYSELLALSK